ncbi:MAG: sigma-70 family RNA polymerase sigma factor [Bacteroidia bacterium]|nr:sigma-70 family RNA polymerase sigma factor [Bacteroidia bacterium]
MSKINHTNFEKEVYEKYYSLVYSTCVRKLHQQDSIDDAVQSTFLLYIKEQENINSTLSSWFYWASKNTCTFINRVASKNKKASGLDDQLMIDGSSQNNICLDKLISSLPKKKRELLLMKYYENMSNKEIAEKTNGKEASIKSTIERTISLLQSKFKKKDVLVTALLAQLFHVNKTSASTLSSSSFILQNSLIQQSIVKGVLKMVFIHKLNFLLLNLFIAGVLCTGGFAIHAQETNVEEVISVDRNKPESELSENKTKEDFEEEKRKHEIISKAIGPDMVTKTYKTELKIAVFQINFTLRRMQGIFGRRLWFLKVKREKPIKIVLPNGEIVIENFFFQVKCEKKILDMVDGVITNLLSEKTINQKFIIKYYDREYYIYIHYLDKKINYKKSRPLLGGIKNRSLFFFPQKNAVLMLSSKKNHSSCKKDLDDLIEIHKN